MNIHLAKSISFAVCLLLAGSCFSQFQGIIDFTRKKGSVFIKYKYYVSGQNVRIEELNTNGDVEGIQLVNLESKKIFALNPTRKLFFEVSNRRPSPKLATKVKATGKTKEIHGKTCEEWIVKNDRQDRSISFWMSKGEYNFFIPLLNVLNRREKFSVYFLTIAENRSFFPMYAAESTKSGELLGELTVTNMESKALDKELFVIPKGYTEFER